MSTAFRFSSLIEKSAMHLPDVDIDIKQCLAMHTRDFIKQLQCDTAAPPMVIAVDRQTAATFYLASDPDFPVDDQGPTTEQVLQRVTAFARPVFTEPLVSAPVETRIEAATASLLIVYRWLKTDERGQFVVRASRSGRNWQLADVEGPASCDWEFPAEGAVAWRGGFPDDVRYRLQEVIKARILHSAKTKTLVVPTAVGVDALSGGVYAAGDAFCWTPRPEEMLDEAFVLDDARRALSRWPRLVLGIVQGRKLLEESNSIQVRLETIAGVAVTQFMVSRQAHKEWLVSGTLPDIARTGAKRGRV